jgi:16S rRNA (guanine527-N7)-methyltransferase
VVLELGSREWRALISDGADQLGITLQETVPEQFAVYAAELAAWNRKINLTAIKAPAEIAIKHFIDSIAPLSILPRTGMLLDVGTGGGFPGLPLKIASTQLNVTLLDASRKKINFIKHIIRVLRLHATDALQMRIEHLGRQEAFQKRFDIIVSRAFSSLSAFVQQAQPLLASQGIMVAFKGRQVDQELEELKAAKGKPQEGAPTQEAGLPELDLQVVRYTLPFLETKRALVILKNRR